MRAQGGGTSLIEAESWRTVGYDSHQGPAWWECHGQFGVQNSKGHPQELSTDEHVPSVWLIGLAKAVAVWQDAAIVRSKPCWPLLGLSHACHKEQRPGGFSLSERERETQIWSDLELAPWHMFTWPKQPKHTAFTSLNGFHFPGEVIKRRKKEIPCRGLQSVPYHCKKNPFLLTTSSLWKHRPQNEACLCQSKQSSGNLLPLWQRWCVCSETDCSLKKLSPH